MNDYLQRAPFVRILVPLVAGILLSAHLPEMKSVFVLFLLAALFVCLLLAGSRKKRPGDVVHGLLFFCFFLLSGIAAENYRNRETALPAGDYYMAILRETPLEKPRSYKAEAQISHCLAGDSAFRCRESILVYFSKSEKAATLKPGSRIIFKRTPGNIENQSNPYEFDYKRFAGLKGIHRQVYLKDGDWRNEGKAPGFNLHNFAETLRESLLSIFIENGITGTSFDLLSALTLGYRKTIDPEINRVFAATGATHVLSVSGLHVGILYLMIRAAFGFLRKRKQTRWIYLLLAFAGIWGFALITGFSPPVQRSALMFSLFLIGENLRRPVNIYNSLAASACILLFINPNLLYDIGFQLSYVALTGIVYFQPLLDTLVSFSNQLCRYAWSLLTVSIAAQLATFPLTIFYFNQFPLYFWLSGFIVVPLSFAFLFLGIALLVTSPLPVIPMVLAKVAVFLVKIMLWSLHAIENMPGSLLKNVSFSLLLFLITSCGILGLVLFIETRRRKYLFLLLALTLIGMVTSSVTQVKQNLHREIIAYRADQPVVHLLYGKRNYLLAPAKVLSQDFPEGQVNPVMRHFGLERPVLVAWEQDFSDAVVHKKGNAVFFDGVALRCRSADGSTGIPEMDFVFNALPEDGSRDAEVKSIVVGYSRYSLPERKETCYHAVHQEGAWRFRIHGRSSFLREVVDAFPAKFPRQ